MSNTGFVQVVQFFFPFVECVRYAGKLAGYLVNEKRAEMVIDKINYVKK